jgi:two-component system sensor histidine kinase VicK
LFFFYNVQADVIDYANPAFEEIARRDLRAFRSNPSSLYEIVHPEDRKYVEISLQQFRKRMNRSLLDFRIRWPDNTERWIRLKIYPIVEDNQMRYVGGIVEDDSARKTSIFNMEKVNAWKDSTLEILAHDLKGPIGVVQMVTASIKKQLPGTEYKQIHEWTSIIHKICQRNIELIRTLLKNESLETEALDFSRERVDVVWEVTEILNFYQKVQRDIYREFQCSYSHEKIFAEIDSMKFMQIFNNLISNAIKFTKEGGVIKLHVEKLERTILFTVSDNGIGIPKDLYPYLFNKYTKAGRPGLGGEESVGLGLWIVKSVTKAHGGRIWFESEVGKGTTFYIEIPLDVEAN